MIQLQKRLFRQGELVSVLIKVEEDKQISEATLSLIGNEKVEFTMQSLVGTKGYNPSLSGFLPSRHLAESTDFLNQVISLDPNSFVAPFTIELEIPANAIPSWYSTNSKVHYQIELDITFEGGVQRQFSEPILIDAPNEQTTQEEKIELQSGQITVRYANPLLINTENQLELSVQNALAFSPLRIVMTGTEYLTASGVPAENELPSLPLAQIQYDEDFANVPIKFSIPLDYQHSYEGLLSRVEYAIEIHQITSSKKRLRRSQEKTLLLRKIPVTLEYPINIEIDQRKQEG